MHLQDMLNYGVDVKQLSNLRRTFESSLIKRPPGKLESPAQTRSPGPQDGVSLSVAPAPTTAEVSPPPESPREAPPVRLQTIDGAPLPTAADGGRSITYSNAPLLQEMECEPVYAKELEALEGRYPGVAKKLSEFEVEAARQGYHPTESKQVEQSVLSSPPWPTTEFGDPIDNIGAKAKELQTLHPELKTSDPAAYDFKKANREAGRLMEELESDFPKDQFPGVVMGVRAKTPQSLARKMEKQTAQYPDFTLAHLTDTVGARIDSPDLMTMATVTSSLEAKYGDQIVAKSDYVSNPGANGYRAIHYTVNIDGRMVEIQASTTALRTADLATHDTIYKPEFPVSPQTAQELSTAADRIMFLECLKLKESS
ncbi:MAG: hypothetical protein WC314_17240 [Vulcanimicrobiota bacterium]